MVEFHGETEAERWDGITGPANSLGWAIWLDKFRNREAVCPACVEKERSKVANLKPFGYIPCPMCGGRTVTKRFCDGLPATCTLGAIVSHLHWTCGKCGYGWETNVKESENEQRSIGTINGRNTAIGGDGWKAGVLQEENAEGTPGEAM